MRKPGYLLLFVVAVAAATINCGKTQSVNAAAGETDGNLAPVPDSSQTAQNIQSQAPANPNQTYPGQAPADYNQAPGNPNQAAAPVYSQTANNQDDGQYYDDQADDSGAAVYASQPPPPLPQYNQPPCPGDNYIWTPGYWGYADAGYYWVPGVWVLAPYVDALWTPPYWEFYGNRYRWHRGYWGSHIGFYGGIDYGFGYTGRGYYGGYWNGGRFAYNRAVTNVNTNIVHNVYQRPVTNVTVNRISYNGGPGGTNVRPIAAEEAALRERRSPPVAAQIQHARSAETNRQQFAAVNRGRPAVIAQTNALATPYRAPAARPTGPELPRPTAKNEAPRGQVRPGQAPVTAQNERPFGAARGGRPAAAEPAPEPRPVTTGGRQGVPAQRGFDQRGVNPSGQQAPRQSRQPEPAQRQPEVARPQAQPQARPEVARPAPQARPLAPQPRPEARPQPQVREAPSGRTPFERPAPAARPEPQSRPEARRPNPPAQSRPEPAARTAPAPRPAPPAQAAPRPAPPARGGEHGREEKH